MPAPTPQPATCLGCGCLCDDIELTIDQNAIAASKNLCPLGEQWFGSGELPTDIRANNQSPSLDEALKLIAGRITRNPAALLIDIADDLSLETHRAAIALADRLGASIDGLAADTVAPGLLAAARRGRVSGTLGELRHRADLVLWWACDPTDRYPRFIERFIDAPSRFVTNRRQIAIDIGPAAAPPALADRLRLDPHQELDVIGELRAHLAGHPTTSSFPAVKPLADACANANYIAIIFDAEPDPRSLRPDRAEALLALGRQLHDTRHAAVWGLRAGGNRNGFESVLTWQTGFPMSVDFGKGHPEFVAQESPAERLARGRYQTVLVIGDPHSLPDAVREQLEHLETIVIGPQASTADFHPVITMNTGRLGIHEPGLALRMDDVPLEINAPLDHPHRAMDLINRLVEIA